MICCAPQIVLLRMQDGSIGISKEDSVPVRPHACLGILYSTVLLVALVDRDNLTVNIVFGQLMMFLGTCGEFR